MASEAVTNDLVAELRSWMEPYGEKELDVLLGQAASEIERLTVDFAQVHHNCIHARQVADKALELLAQVPMPFQSISWRQAVHDVMVLAKTVPPLPALDVAK